MIYITQTGLSLNVPTCDSQIILLYTFVENSILINTLHEKLGNLVGNSQHAPNNMGLGPVKTHL